MLGIPGEVGNISVANLTNNYACIYRMHLEYIPLDPLLDGIMDFLSTGRYVMYMCLYLRLLMQSY